MTPPAIRLGLAALLLAALWCPALPAAEATSGSLVVAVSLDGGALAVSDPDRKRTVVYRRSAGDNLKKLWSVDHWFPEIFVWNGGGLRSVQGTGWVCNPTGSGSSGPEGP